MNSRSNILYSVEFCIKEIGYSVHVDYIQLALRPWTMTYLQSDEFTPL
jgi:hypothetical protein